MVTPARKSSEARKSKKQEAEGKELGEGGEEAPLSSFPLGHFALSSPASLDSTDWRGTAENTYHTYLHILQNLAVVLESRRSSRGGGGGVAMRSPCTLPLDLLLYKNCATADISMLS